MYIVNKIVGSCLNPLAVGIALIVAGGVLLWRGRRTSGFAVLAVSVFWLWAWSTPAVYRRLGGSLERAYPAEKAEAAAQADAIVVLGGGMGSNTNAYPYAEMWSGADRVWHAARLYKAGKAPVVIATGRGERESTVPLLLDLGVPAQAIVVEDQARNTEENAKFVERVLMANANPATRKVLLVTSAWHMRRSLLMYRKYAPNLEIVPAAADYEATVNTFRPFSITDILPDANMLYANSYVFKEYLGYWGYRLLRR